MILQDETIRANFEKFGKDARKLAAEFTPEELAMYILSLTVQDPDSLPEVEIAREKPLPFKPSGNGFGGKGKGGRRGDDRCDRDRRGNGRRDDFKKVVVEMIVMIRKNVTVRIIKKTTHYFKRKENRLCYSYQGR